VPEGSGGRPSSAGLKKLCSITDSRHDTPPYLPAIPLCVCVCVRAPNAPRADGIRCPAQIVQEEQCVRSQTTYHGEEALRNPVEGYQNEPEANGTPGERPQAGPPPASRDSTDELRRKDLETKLRWAEEALYNRKQILSDMNSLP